MTRLLKGALAIQFAIAGVALAQNQDTDQTRHDSGVGGLVDLGQSQKAPAGTVRASTLIGAEVYNHAGKHLGEIKDIVLDKDTKRVGYAVLSYGGIVGMGDKLFAMPHKMIRYSAAENRAEVHLDENVLKNAPGFDQSKWPTEANADYYRKLDSYYQQETQRRAESSKDELDRSADEAKTAADKTDAKLNADHDVTAQPAAGQVGELTWNRRVSSVIGANVENTQGDNLGEVQDLVLDWGKGEVRYAVLSYGGVMGIGDKLFAVPMGAFQSQQDDSKLVLNVSKDQLKNAPGFNKDQWPNMADPLWTKQVSDFYDKNRAGQDRAD